MKTILTYLIPIFLLIFAVLFIIVYIEIYFIMPTSWIYSEVIRLELIITVIFGSSALLMILLIKLKPYFIKWKKAKCKVCGNRNRINALHCDRCGEKL